MGYLAAGPGKEGFNVYTFSDRVPINSNSDAQKYLAIPTKSTNHQQGGKVVYKVVELSILSSVQS